MNDYISRQDALRRIDDFVAMAQYRMLSIPKDSELYRFTEIQYGDRKNIYKAVADIPVADVRPVMYGQWEMTKQPGVYACSICGCYGTRHEAIEYNFCPHCGADMRGKANE